MAKKGGVQQLQTEINTNEELTKFLDRDGLIGLNLFILVFFWYLKIVCFSFRCLHRVVRTVSSYGWQFEKN